MAIRFSTGLRNRLLGMNGTDTGANGLRGIFHQGVIEIYTGSQPSSANDAVTGTLLGTVTVAAGAFTPGVGTNGLEWDAPASGAITKKTGQAWQFAAVASGNAGWWRLKGNATDAGSSSTTLPRVDGTCGTSGADMIVSSTSVTSGVTHTIDTFSLTLDAS